MNLKGLVHREIGEGLTEEQLASTVGVSVGTIKNILADEPPQDRATWKLFARYFRIDVDFLQIGGPPYSEGQFDRTESANPSPLGQMRKVPLLRWDQINQMVRPEEPSRVIQAEAMLETDVPGIRTFAMQVRDDSMEPLFSEGEVIFVNPDLPSKEPRPSRRGFCKPRGNVPPLRYGLPFLPALPSGASWQILVNLGTM